MRIADYKLYGRCQYGVPSHDISQVSDCGDDGIAWIWWGSQDSGFKVCRKHLDKILGDEEAEEEMVDTDNVGGLS